MNFKQNNPNMGKECANETRYNNIGQRHHCNNNIEKLLTYNITGQNRKKIDPARRAWIKISGLLRSR